MKLTIGISYAPEGSTKYSHYREAIEHAATVGGYDVEIVEVWRNPARVPELDGILFTGGSDIDPVRYGKQAEVNLCDEIDEARDQIEFTIADASEQNGIPTLGICRGLQLLNVHRGGTLVTDIEKFGGGHHTKIADADSRHRVQIASGSYLRKILGAGEGEINSAHHQAAERVGEGFTVSARAQEDGTIEGLEWADPTGKPFFLAVQWHPERMGYDEKFAGRLFDTFLWEVAMQKTLKHRMGDLKTPNMSS